MKRFKFRLQKVLDYRTSEKRECERELARRNHDLYDAEEDLEQIIEASERSVIPVGDILTVGDIMMHGDYQARLREALEEQRALIIQAAEAVDMAREAYVAKAIETKALETVRQNRKNEHQQEVDKQQKKAVDEIVVQRYGATKKMPGEDS